MENNLVFNIKEFEEQVLNQPQSLFLNRKRRLPAVTPMDEISPYRPFFLEYSLTNEYNLLIKQKISSVLIIPSSKLSTTWNGVIFVRHGLYQGGVFRIRIQIPNNFPDSNCPEVFFCPPIFHPMIHPTTGALNVIRAFHSWRQNYHHIWQVVQFAKRIFIKIETEDSLNKEAAALYNKDFEAFKKKAEYSIEMANEILYEDPDPEDDQAIRFSKLDEEHFKKIKNEILNKKKEIQDTITNKKEEGQSLYSEYYENDENKTNNIVPSL